MYSVISSVWCSLDDAVTLVMRRYVLCSKRDEEHPYNFSVIGSLKATFQNFDLCLRQKKAIAELEESLDKQSAAAQQTRKRQEGRSALLVLVPY